MKVPAELIDDGLFNDQAKVKHNRIEANVHFPKPPSLNTDPTRKSLTTNCGACSVSPGTTSTPTATFTVTVRSRKSHRSYTECSAAYGENDPGAHRSSPDSRPPYDTRHASHLSRLCIGRRSFPMNQRSSHQVVSSYECFHEAVTQCSTVSWSADMDANSGLTVNVQKTHAGQAFDCSLPEKSGAPEPAQDCKVMHASCIAGHLRATSSSSKINCPIGGR